MLNEIMKTCMYVWVCDDYKWAEKMSGWWGIFNVILFCLFDELAQAYKWINFETLIKTKPDRNISIQLVFSLFQCFLVIYLICFL